MDSVGESPSPQLESQEPLTQSTGLTEEEAKKLLKTLKNGE